MSFPVDRRFLRLREETEYASVSSQTSQTLAYRSFSARASGRTAIHGKVGSAALTRTGQVTLPVAWDGRWRPAVGAGGQIDSGARQRALFNLLMRGAQGGGEDLRSWNFDHQGPHTKESFNALGAKCNGFTLSSNSGGRSGAQLLSLQVQFLYAIEADSAWSPGNDDQLAPNRGFHTYMLEASQVRISPEATLVEDDMLGSLLSQVTQVRIQCRRGVQRPLGGVATVAGVLNPLEPRMTNSRWTVNVSVPLDFDATGIGDALVEAMRSGELERRRYNLRFDFGAASRHVLVALPDVCSAAVGPAIWGYSSGEFDLTATGPKSARTYAVYSNGLKSGAEYASEYTPDGGDMVHYTGHGGQQFDVEEQYGGGYAIQVGEGNVAQGTSAPGYTGPSAPFTDADFFAQVIAAYGGNPWPKDQRPEAHVSFWHSDVPPIVANVDDWTQMRSGGITVSLKSAVLAGSQGLSGKGNQFQFNFTTDSSTDVVLTY